MNKDLNANIDEIKILLEKRTKEHREASSHVIGIKKEVNKKQLALAKVNLKKENLEKTYQSLLETNENLLLKVESLESKLSEFEATATSSSLDNSKATNNRTSNQSTNQRFEAHSYLTSSQYPIFSLFDERCVTPTMPIFTSADDL